MQNHSDSGEYAMTKQTHTGLGDNVARDKYENIIRSVQARDLKSVVDNIMRDVCYRDTDKAMEKLNILSDIDSLESDVRALLSAIQVKIDLVNGSVPSAKQELLSLLKSKTLPNDVRDVVTSILIDLESRTNPVSARERYDALEADSVYIDEIFFERIALKIEIQDCFDSSKRYDFLEQELSGLIRGAFRVQDFGLAVEISRFLDEHFPSKNAYTLLLYSESCLIVTKNQYKHYLSFEKQDKEVVDRLVAKLLGCIEEGDDRHIAILINLLNITFFLDGRIVELGQNHIERIRNMDGVCASTIEEISSTAPFPYTRFELTSDSLGIKDFSNLHFAIDNGLIKFSAVNDWLDKGGSIQTGHDYLNTFAELQLTALLCSNYNKQDLQSLGSKAQDFFELDIDQFMRLNLFAVKRLCERFIELELPLYAVQYLSPFIPDKSWVSPIFLCYLDALFASEKYDLFFLQIKHLSSEDKTEQIWIQEALLYERIKEFKLSIISIRAAIELTPCDSYAWYLLLFILRSSGVSLDVLKDTVFEIPEGVFSTYHESKMHLVNEIAAFIDNNLADRVLVDWFAQEPDKVATPLTQVHANSLSNRFEVTSNPYIPKYCCDGVTYTDGFDKFTRILVRDVDTSHSCLLDVDSPTGQLLVGLQVGESIKDGSVGEITLLERLSPFVAAFRMASELRHKGNDGTDVFKIFTMPKNEKDFLPYIEKIIRRYTPEDKEPNSALQNPNIPLVMKGHFTNPESPIKGALKHLTSMDSTQYMNLFDKGVGIPDKVVVDIYTAVYFALVGLASNFNKLSIDIILSQRTKHSLELWIKDILREDYLSLDISDRGLHRYTSEDIRRDSLGFIQELQALLQFSKVEALKPLDTPDNLVKIRGIIDETVYSTFQLSVANSIPWLCVDQLMCILAHKSGYLVANTNTIIIELLNSLSLESKKKSIQFNLLTGAPVPILYDDIAELSRSSDNHDVYLVAKFIEKYGVSFESPEVSLSFLTEIVGRVTVNAYLEGGILSGGRSRDPSYAGFAEDVFNYCCRVAITALVGDTAEQRLALFISNVLHEFGRVRRYTALLEKLTSTFATGHFLDIQEINRIFERCSLKYVY